MCLISKKYLGLDIADSSIEVALVGQSWGRTKLISVGRVELEAGLVKNGRIIDKEKLAISIKELFQTAKPKAIKNGELCFGLPESQTFLHHFYTTSKDNKEKQKTIEKELAENIPITGKDLAYSLRILNEDKEKTEILVAATRQEVINEWRNFFKSIKLNVVNFDIEILATFRNLFDHLQKEPVMLLDIGANTTHVGVFDEFGLHYEYVINKAGNDFSKIIAEVLEIDVVKAEIEKLKSGLKNRSKKVVEELENELNKIAKAIKESIESYNSGTDKKLAKVVLVGGSSLLIGLPEFFSKSLNIPVEIGKARLTKEKLPLYYVEAIGLALGKAEKHWSKTDPNF
ncbi:MAG: Type IV pilus assembly protein PilM [Candidatus Magasanikbacteria bacterium GW2011_GWC2_37_14]|uniref:Type IV pilus assembly protein PilM n=1 Tax=Candidatus Magasanikbacteria bacterium GW2011_GWC2_37_14 TaxID=1619046 RepID=A0A0G0GNE1_9BACT|nr:MAG: Type IV pilus assembly protein PilM [Candidatus Magasanikbacteria bacterium GW2011_GWC2_37_14]